MTSAAAELQEAQAWLAKTDSKIVWDCAAIAAQLERFAQLFARTSQEQHRHMMSEFHNRAGKLPYFGDKDIGALILESTADGITDIRLRAFLYDEARLRAMWYAQAASSGAEGMARSHHMNTLDAKAREVALNK